ncbi:3,4-dihydroxy-2-butanone-4-phosphate synthase [Rubellicoccus peritrichatus]|uniref:3,4-dihydroxy-2-butanone 4-phosphate synthase n=1 Tax=Rubellicoccus peritrichatus TaxID=3080537 RepID=A0AAQ3LBF7_9BACT|nr:3,4-dihydroxy-2-butanone-4-phosphate synthase [Puniceicoccus sp. CR14]WOO42651.1 3,4-dihydroxy-2-butanone-4-phosphate synthase [Puniceicoccus sp. CR14]
MSESPFDTIEEALSEIAAGRAVVVTDDENRENEGDLIFAASKVSPELVNMMVRYGSGVVCVPMLPHHLDRLGIAPMVRHNREAMRTDYAVSVDAAEGITTGISAYDRAMTIRALADPKANPSDLVQPGHVFPLRAKPGGVLQRAGHTEAAVDLASLAGLFPAGVICELVKEDGDMMRLPDLVEFKEKFGLKLISIADLIHYRHKRDCLVERLATLPFESEFGTFDLHVFRNFLDDRRHFALSLGDLDENPTLVRVQSENLLGDVFRGSKFHGHSSLEAAMARIAEEGHGVVLYIEQPNGGIRIEKTDSGQKLAVGPMHMDFRDYGIGAQILAQLGLKKIRLLMTKPRNVVALDGYDLEIVEQISLGK